MEIPHVEQNNLGTPHPWQLWRPFVGIHRWYFSPTFPPPLRHLDEWAGCIHATVLCAVMGIFVSVLSTAMLVIVPGLLPNGDGTAQVILLGVLYGVLVIYPLSRWIDRTVFGALAGTMVCVLCCACLFSHQQMMDRVIHPWMDSRRFLSAWFIWNLIVFSAPIMVLGLSMHGRRWRTLWMLPIIFLATVMFAMSHVWQSQFFQFWPSAFRQNPIGLTLISTIPLCWFWILLTIAFGMRLWPSMREPDQLSHSAKSP